MGNKRKEKVEELDGTTLDLLAPDPGPLAPWKLTIAVAVSGALTGLPLYDAAMSGVVVDMALMRSFGVAFFVWIAVGSVNKVLRQAQAAVGEDPLVGAESAPRPWVDERSGASESSAA